MILDKSSALPGGIPMGLALLHLCCLGKLKVGLPLADIPQVLESLSPPSVGGMTKPYLNAELWLEEELRSTDAHICACSCPGCPSFLNLLKCIFPKGSGGCKPEAGNTGTVRSNALKVAVPMLSAN